MTDKLIEGQGSTSDGLGEEGEGTGYLKKGKEWKRQIEGAYQW